MNRSYTCPRCWNAHREGDLCPRSGGPLDAHRPNPRQLQHAADAAEALALVRYRLERAR